MKTIKKLNAMPYAQAHIEIDECGNSYLFSYTTLVAQIEEGWLTVFGLYSQTTRRHIGAYMAEMTGYLNYYNAKEAYEGNYKLNVETGEVVEL
jgi:hypothetical protein